MLAYVIRRLLYAVPILLGVNIILFLLFFFVNKPDVMARKILGDLEKKYGGWINEDELKEHARKEELKHPFWGPGSLW